MNNRTATVECARLCNIYNNIISMYTISLLSVLCVAYFAALAIFLGEVVWLLRFSPSQFHVRISKLEETKRYLYFYDFSMHSLN